VKCPACACAERGYPSDVAFLAGIAFAFQFNNDAMRRHVCERHARSIVGASTRALDKVPEEDRRSTSPKVQP
jgi:hypothetical protein